jgi:hypothetical protein
MRLGELGKPSSSFVLWEGLPSGQKSQHFPGLTSLQRYPVRFSGSMDHPGVHSHLVLAYGSIPIVDVLKEILPGFVQVLLSD